MQAGDLAHQRQAEPGALAVAAEPVERHEDMLVLGRRHAGAGVDDGEHGVGRRSRAQLDADRRLAVLAGVLQEVAHQPAQQPRIAVDGDRVAVERAVVVVGAFLGDQRQQVDLLARLRRGGDVEPARQQDFVDQVVELGDVALRARS